MLPKAKKSLGQNFLIDGNYQRKILQSLQSHHQKFNLLEIGPGQGALTQHLISVASYYCAVEKDPQLIPHLKEKLGEDLQVFVGDFLKIDLDFLKAKAPWVAIGNLPYNVASQIFIRLIECRQNFSDFYLMFQKEMALRLVAKHATKDYGLLTLWALIYTEAKILFDLPPTVFRPQPKVFSSFVHFKLRDLPLLTQEEATFFWPTVKILFQHRRKTIGSVLKKYFSVPASSIKNFNLQDRAEDLDFFALKNLVLQMGLPLAHVDVE